MQPDLEADTAGLRKAASAESDTASRITAASGQATVGEVTPRWATAGAAILAAEAARQQLALIGADLEDTARRIRTAAEEYELADARAATRLRLSR